MRFYHGSPYNIESFADSKVPIFFTQDKNVAYEYATKMILGAHRPPKNISLQKQPTIYTVELTNIHPFDLRKQEHINLYNSLRDKLSREQRNEYGVESIEAEGFIQYHRLPSYGKVYMLNWLLRGKGFDSIWIDESTQGISLALFDNSKINVVSKELVESTKRNNTMKKVNEKVDFSKTRTPEQFINYVDSVLKELDADLRQLGHITNTYSQSATLNQANKETMKNYNTLLSGLDTYVKRAITAPQAIKGFKSTTPVSTLQNKQMPMMRQSSWWDRAKNVFGK